MIDLSKFNGIIFDIDGTLVDLMRAHIDAWYLKIPTLGEKPQSEQGCIA